MTTNFLDYLTIGLFFALMLSVGFVFNRLNKNPDDYFRGGCKGTWWLVGTSAFMFSFTAFTFTGAASVAYQGGWSVFLLFGSVSLGYFISAIWLAPWFRQMRIYAAPQISEQRWHKPLARVSFYIHFPFSMIYPSIALYGSCIFASAMFGMDINLLIIILGGVVMLYSMSGGVWGVMATDFLQGAILLPLTIVVAVLCLGEVGGFSGLFNMIEAQGLTDDYRMVKDAAWDPEQHKFTWFWGLAIFLGNITNMLGLGNALRYSSVKDGRSAQWAAALGGVLFIIGALIWFIPPVVARLLHADQVMAVDIPKPAEASYAIAALNYLPDGLKGLMAVCIFSATMSSLDTGMNRQTASFFNVFVPDVCRLFKRPVPESQESQVLLSRMITMFLGLVIIFLALHFANMKDIGVFGLILKVKAFLVGFAVVGLWGLFIKRAPLYAPYASMIAGALCGIITIFSEPLFGVKLNFQETFFINFLVPSLAFFACIPFFKRSSQEFKDRVDAFFVQMKTPVDFEKEVGAPEDIVQLVVIGRYTIIIGAYIALLAFFVDNTSDVAIILALAAMILAFGGMLYAAGMRSKKRLIAFAKAQGQDA